MIKIYEYMVADIDESYGDDVEGELNELGNKRWRAMFLVSEDRVLLMREVLREYSTLAAGRPSVDE